MAKWNLSALFRDTADLQACKEQVLSAAKDFEQKYKNKLATLSNDEFAKALAQYENIIETISRVLSYAYLCFASDTTQGALYASCELEMNAVSEHILFFDIEYGSLEKSLAEQLAPPKYAYYLSRIYQNRQHLRTLEEENIILKLSPVGANAFSRLFSEHFSRLRFRLGNQTLSEEEILSKLYHPKRKKRKQAANALTKVLRKELPLLTYIFNTIKKEWAIMQELRHYQTPEESRHIDNQTTQKSVDCMLEVINENMSIVAEFYTLKKSLMGKTKLYDYDRYAPLGQENQHFEYKTAQQIVLKSLQDFCPTFGEIAQRAFDEGWIDSHPRAHKQSGAFSHPTVPCAHPYVLLNFTHSRRDVFTMAHELGHAIHQELSRSVGYLNADTPLTTSETASVFAEMLLFESMKATLNGNQKISLYTNKLEDIFATLFRQAVFTNFERKIHDQVGEIPTEMLNKIWLDENQKMFGDSVILTENYALWWSYIPHFIHSPFYCYAYSYGQLLVMALFGLYRQQKESFVPRYLEFLRSGGSKTPKELVGLFGFDIESRHFWEQGISEIRLLVQELKALLKNKHAIMNQ